MYACETRGAGRQEKHVAFAEQMLGAHDVKNRARVDASGYAKADTRRKVRLDQTGDDIDTRPLRGKHKMHTDRPRHLRQARYAILRRCAAPASSNRPTHR